VVVLRTGHSGWSAEPRNLSKARLTSRPACAVTGMNIKRGGRKRRPLIYK